MQPASVKKAAHKLIDELPDDATWDDVLYRMAVRRSIEAGLRQSEEGDVVDTRTVRMELGLPE
jgi:hypothetical protein